ncbi:MAG: hypothetical protein K2V38_00380 [Gemmataceae bacterium]|nr:hypothetical protein [Gemmataceae bacterium]
MARRKRRGGELGDFVRDHRPRGRVIGLMILCAAFAVLFLFGAVRVLNVMVASSFLTLLGLAFLGGVAVFFGWGAVRHFLLAQHRLDVFDDGFRLSRVLGAVACRWDDIERVRYAVSYGVSPEAEPKVVLTVERFDGPPLVLTELTDIDNFVDRVYEKTGERLLADALEQIEDGRHAKFGPFRVEAEGVTWRGQFTPWERVKAIRMADDAVVVKRRGGSTLRESLKATPNPHVLVALVEELRDAARKSADPTDRPPEL